jgi:YidC/Oxa1 family membrane protein insertase
MRQNAFNVVVFLFLAAAVTGIWWYADEHWLPKKDAPKNDPAVKQGEEKDRQPLPAKPTSEAVAALTGSAANVPPAPPPPKKVEPTKPPEPLKPADWGRLIAFGGDDFFLKGFLTSRGGGLQQLVLTGFHEANRLGREEKVDGNPIPLYLIPGIYQPHGLKLADNPPVPDLHAGKAPDPNDPATPDGQRLVEASYLLYHYPTADDKYPDPLLGQAIWTVAAEEHPADGPHKVVFETTLPDPYLLKVRKTFTLGKRDYHIGLRVEFERLPGGQKSKGQVRFQLAGPRGLPVEGEWYTNTTRTALIGWENQKGAFKRQYEDAATIGMMRGGERVERVKDDTTFKYAAIATQYFSSALAIDPDNGDNADPNPWAYVRATSELPFIPSPEEIKKLEEEAKANPVGVAASQMRHIQALRDRKLPELDDISFRAVTDPIDLGPGERTTHGYAVYNGPTKVRLLKLLKGEQAVDAGLVDRYHDSFGLRTLTDYRSPTALGRFADFIYWTDLVILFTNLMHGVLWLIHAAIGWLPGSWGFSIIILTVLVRLLLLVPSRKQTQMNMKMMEVQKKLKPELDKLHEKYKDDFQTYNREKTRLMMQHGMNPFAAMGGCLLLFAQMPIFMGLYYCLQESIFFRLEPFLWVNNLAAPDMTVGWGEGIPLISDPDNRHGTWSFLYLGPYLNVLPLIAVGLMLYQQNKMMPPPTDEQQAAQQRMMKFMMIVVALMFYKVAAGLALYFIVSTGWGLIERQLIPKPVVKPGDDDSGSAAGLPPKGGSPNGHVAPAKAPGFLGKLRQRLQEKIEELQKRAEEQASRQHRNEPRGGGDQSPTSQPGNRAERRQQKKKRK